MPNLTRKGFRAWLEGKDASARVGEANSRYCCPIAKYMDARMSLNNCEVCQTVFFSDSDNENSQRPLPKWAREFICVLDDKGHREVTATEALKVLDSL